MKPKRPTIRSKQPCPVCGGREWYPMIIPRTDPGAKIGDAAHDCLAPYQPVVDAPCGYPCAYDECAKCGIVCC